MYLVLNGTFLGSINFYLKLCDFRKFTTSLNLTIYGVTSSSKMGTVTTQVCCEVQTRSHTQSSLHLGELVNELPHLPSPKGNLKTQCCYHISCRPLSIISSCAFSSYLFFPVYLLYYTIQDATDHNFVTK